MADPLYELLAPFFDTLEHPPSPRDLQTTNYLTRLNTLSLNALTSTESDSLLHSAQSHVRNLQALSKRSHRAVITSASHLTSLTSLLPAFGAKAGELQTALPDLEGVASGFAQKYDRNTENAVLDRRKRAMLLARNVDRVSDVLDLPSLLSSTVSAGQAGSAGTSTSAATTSYASALDLHAHIRRLNALYPQSGLVASISDQFDVEMQNLATILITSLQSPSLKLAAAMRTIGLLRRVAPELADGGLSAPASSGALLKNTSLMPTSASNDGALGALFLICRLRTLHKTFEALDPLRELADQETSQIRNKGKTNGKASRPPPTSSGGFGGQSERYLKRYIDIFREQSFAILSMYKSIFPINLPAPDPGAAAAAADEDATATDSTPTADPLLPLPSSLSSFALHLAEMLMATLREYLPNITDKPARASLLTQVFYCAGSLGRLGAEFGMLVALLEEDLSNPSGGDPETKNDSAAADPDDEHHDHDERATELEWVQVMKKHRVQASRLEVLARGVGSGMRKTSMEVPSPGASASPVAAG